MNETGKPRHIRDIAHIYLSRLENSRPVAHDRLVVCGESRTTIPAFHVAAVAAAFALKASAARSPLDVSVSEVSGVLPNVGYYFSLPARICLAHKREELSEPVTALMGIRVGFSWGSPELRNTTVASPRLEIHHIPPFENRNGFQRALAGLGRASVGGTVFLFITRDGGNLCSMRDTVASIWGEGPIYTLGVGSGHGEFVADQLGAVSTWESSAVDRMPVIFRDPRSMLALRYQSLCEGLIYKIREHRRNNGGTDAGGQPADFDVVRSNNR